MPKAKRPRRLTPKERRFVYEYCRDMNGSDAVRRAGYSEIRPDQKAYELLRKHEISAAISKTKAEQLKEANISAIGVLERQRRMCYSELTECFDEKGNLKPFKEWTPENKSALAGFEVIKKNAQGGDGHIDTIYKFKFWNKNQAADTLCKHLGLLQGDREPPQELVPCFIIDQDVDIE